MSTRKCHCYRRFKPIERTEKAGRINFLETEEGHSIRRQLLRIPRTIAHTLLCPAIFPHVSKNSGCFYRFTKDSNVDAAEVSQNGGILLANLLQSSRSTFSWRSFLSFLAFKEGMLSTPISVLGGWPTVSGGFRETPQCIANNAI